MAYYGGKDRGERKYGNAGRNIKDGRKTGEGYGEKYIEDNADEVIAGRNPVIEALKAGKSINTVYISGEGGSLGIIRRMAEEKGIPVKKADDRKLSEITGGASHQGVAALGACAEYASVEDILAVSVAKGTKPFIIICDGIEDPHNLGAILRTAEAAGADGVIIPKRRSASLTGTVYKTSAGAAGWIPVARTANITAAIELLKENGVWIYGTDASGSDYTQADFRGGTALVIGSEGYGMGRLVREKCDFLLSLPMNGKINSLNASVAAGIFMYEAVRQRRQAE